MRFTTPDKPVDVAELFPELAGLARTAVRLHPRAGATTVRESSLGGPLLWPADEAWPVCEVDHPDPRPLTSAEGRELERRLVEAHRAVGASPHDAALYRAYQAVEADIRRVRRVEYADDPAARLPMVAIAQFYARDVPELPFPEGTDVCQVLWCPTDHDPHYAPLPRVWWRDASTVTAVATAPEPDRDLSEEEYLPTPCRIAPERVVEYPDWDDLPSDELRERISAWERGQEWRYRADLATAPGTKVGGWPDWIQSPVEPECDRGHRMVPLLTVASGEVGAWRTWLPVETRAEVAFQKEVRFATVDGGTGHTVIERDEVFDPAGFRIFGRAVVPESVEEELIPDYRTVPRGMDMMLGDVGNLYIFMCPHCPDRPVEVEFQCT
ncbi:DUF1963 domain-containing protein [Saccharothrix obliqua]|uniref:DUF1963 domain-containing protein n=1 Tax=Saccharothrix obliqua TaxID=2861747 RepID=UPI001C5ECDBB|nr:DUF1963 domain-containing protein [Saccharothrix obliqua]MBW4717200.1 hypothetical protein [Saccharothrix obliqua]